MLRTDTRYLRLKARTASGVLSASFVEVANASNDQVTGGSTGDLGNNGTVATVDAAANAFTDPHQAIGSGTVTTSLTTFGTVTITLNGGTVLIQGAVHMALGGSWLATDLLSIELQKDGAPLDTPILQGPVGPWLISIPVQWTDTSGDSGSHTYRIQCRRTGSSTATVTNILSVVEFKR